jgi:HEAT repeat protein
MTGPISTTFKLLGSTANAHAVDLLVAALDVADDAISTAAVSALLERRSMRGIVEVIRRLDKLSDAARDDMKNQTQRVAPALKQSLLHGDGELRRNALQFVQTTGDCDQFGPILAIVSDGRSELGEMALRVLGELVNRLHEFINFGTTRTGEGYIRNPSWIRQSALAELDKAVSSESGRHKRELIELILVLGDADHAVVRKILSQEGECRDVAVQTLLESAHPGVMHLILNFMSKNYPHAVAFQAVAERKDAEFICHWLRWFPARLTETQQKNFQQVEHVAWLKDRNLSLDFVPAGLQKNLVALVSALGIPPSHKMAVQEWLVRYGSLEGRLAASEVLSQLDEDEVENIIYSGLEADDEKVQAWATSQLRSQHIPEAVSLLLARLDSPLESVRDVARNELGSFNVQFMLDYYEHLSPEAARRAGALIQKIESDCAAKLAAELANPVLRRRIRAARAALAMGMHTKVVPSLLAMLDDEDQLSRRTGIEILGHVPTREVAASLQLLLEDPSPRVRDDAARALGKLQRALEVADGHPKT